MATSIFYFLRILTLILYIFLLILYIFLLSGGFNNSFIYYINDYRYKRKYNQFKNELISSKWYYDILVYYNYRRKCVLSLYDNMTYTLSLCKKDYNNEEDISVIEEGIYHIVNVEMKSPMCRVDLIGNDNNNRFDMILYNKKNRDKIDAFRKGVDFYDKDACVVFYKD